MKKRSFLFLLTFSSVLFAKEINVNNKNKKVEVKLNNPTVMKYIEKNQDKLNLLYNTKLSKKELSKYLNIINNKFKLNLNSNDLCYNFDYCKKNINLDKVENFKVEKIIYDFLFGLRQVRNYYKENYKKGAKLFYKEKMLIKLQKLTRNESFINNYLHLMKLELIKNTLLTKKDITVADMNRINKFLYGIKNRFLYEELFLITNDQPEFWLKYLKNNKLIPKEYKLGDEKLKEFVDNINQAIRKSAPLYPKIEFEDKEVPLLEKIDIVNKWDYILKNVFNNYRNVLGPKFEYNKDISSNIYVAYLPFYDKFQEAILNEKSLKFLNDTRKNNLFWYNKPFAVLISIPKIKLYVPIIIKNYYYKLTEEFYNDLQKQKNFSKSEKNKLFNKFLNYVISYNNKYLTKMIFIRSFFNIEHNKFIDKNYKKLKEEYFKFINY